MKNTQNTQNTQKAPLISIGLITYNHEKYIADCLKGILAQSYSRMELIILDDYSLDNTASIIKEYMPKLLTKFERVKFIKHDKNSGNIPKNYNEIEKEIKGDFFFGVSGDDINLPDCVKILHENLIMHPECSVIYANGIYIDENFSYGDLPDIKNLKILNKNTGIESDTLFKQLMYINFIFRPSVLMYSNLFEKYGYHDETLVFEDYEYWLRISQKEKFFYLNVPVVLYRRAQTSYTNFKTENGEMKLRATIEFTYKCRKKYIDKLPEEEVRECWETFYKGFSYIIINSGYNKLLPYLKSLINAENYNISTDEYKKFTDRMNYENYCINVIQTKGNNIALYIKNYLKKENPIIAIYGLSKSGRALLETLVKNNINVKYIIDKKGDMINAPIPVYKASDKLTSVDVVIVAPFGIYNEVYPLIKSKISCVLDLSEMIKNVENGSEVRGDDVKFLE